MRDLLDPVVRAFATVEPGFVGIRAAIARVPVTSQLWEQLGHLLKANHDATETDSPLNLDRWAIQGMHPQVWVVRVKDEPLGYCSHVVGPHPVYGEKWATCLAIYLHPKFRFLAADLVRVVEGDLKADGVQVIAYGVPHHSRAASFLERMEYDCREVVMAKRLQ